MTTQRRPITLWQSKTTHWAAQLFGLILAALLASSALANELTASVDRTSISIDDRIVLTLRMDGVSPDSGPDLSELSRDFEILSNQSQRRLNIINNQQTAWLEWNLRLAPKHTGNLTIPALEIDGLRSQPISILVSDAPVHDSRDADIFIETEVNKDSVYVQEQLLFTVRLFSRVNLEGAEIQPLDLADAVIKAVDENSYITEIDQRDHLVVETTFAVFPQRSGELVIPSIVYDVAPSRARQDPWSRIYGGGERQRLRAPEVRIPVQPIASEFTGDVWLPATEVRFSEHWSADPDNLTQGEPVTRRITLYADGLTAAQLPAIPYEEVPGANLYPDQAQTDEQISAEGIAGSVTQTLALVPNETGRLHLPEISLPWWDTESGQVRQATLPARELRVNPAAGGASPTSNANLADPELFATDLSLPRQTPPGFSPLYWGWLAASGLLILALLWLSFAYLRLRRQLSELLNDHSQQQHQERKLEKAAWAHLKQQAKRGTLSDVRDALLGWARSYWDDESLHSLSAVAQHSQSPGLQHQLQALDRSLFSHGESAALNLQALLQEVDALRVRRRKQQRETSALPPLYKN